MNISKNPSTSSLIISFILAFSSLYSFNKLPESEVFFRFISISICLIWAVACFVLLFIKIKWQINYLKENR